MAYRVEVDLNELLGITEEINARIRARVNFAVRSTAEEGANRWKKSVMDAKLWQGEKKRYVKAIAWKNTGDMSALVYSDYEHAYDIETGRPQRDLKQYLQTSRKTREAKSGPHAHQKYLIIPFRHNVPTASGKGVYAPQMPRHVYQIAKELAKSSVLAPGSINPRTRISASGQQVRRHSFQWGGRLPAGLAPKLKAEHHSDPYAGMVRFNTSRRSAKVRASAYLTFRVMGEWSDGWVVPPQPGQYLAKGVADSLHGLLEGAIRESVARG